MGVVAFNPKAIAQTNNVQVDSLKRLKLQHALERAKNFPATRYYGSKRKLLPWIFDCVKSLPFETALDGFGGTASVSLLFKAMGKQVTYADAFSFNHDIARAVLADQVAIKRPDFIAFVESVVPESGFITGTFKGMYYKPSENKWLDGFMKKLLSANLAETERAVYLYALFQACLMKRPFNLFHRANLKLRLNKDVERRFGNFTTWERSFTELMLRSYDELQRSVWVGRYPTRILESNSIARASAEFDLVYFDPPYVSNITKNNNDHYFKRYHFLEGLTSYSKWEGLIDQSSLIKEIKAPQWFIDWNNKETFQEKLFGLLKKHKQSIVVLSYVTDAYPSFEVLKEFFEENFSEVTIHIKEHNHALAKQRKKELLFIGRP